MAVKMADLEYHALVDELKEYEGKFFGKFYRIDNNLFRIKLGSRNLMIKLSNYAYLSDKSFIGSEEPDSFVMAIRKRTFNRRIVKVVQPGFERIIEFHFEDGRLIFEMFSKGNIIYINRDGVIQLVLYPESWRDREIRKGVEYKYPPGKKSPFEVKPEDISINGKRTLIAGVLSKISLSPKYMEEAFNRVGLDPKMKADPTDEVKSKLVSAVLEVCSSKEFFVYIDENFPVDYSVGKLSKYTFPVKKFDAFSAAVEFYYSNVKEELSSEGRGERVKEQWESKILELREEIELNSKKGDLIYLHYNALESLISLVKSLRSKGMNDIEINKFLAENNYKAKVKGYVLEVEVEENG